MENTTNTTTTTTTTTNIDNLARKASAGTLKRIYTATGNKRILDLMHSLQADFSIIDNPNDYNALQTISDAYDVYTTAYEYLFDMIVYQGYNEQDTITITLKNNKEKTRTIYQWACVKVRQYIYSNKSLENNGKYIYIEDLSHDTDDGISALDKEYIRMGKYNGIDTYNDYSTYINLLNTLNLTKPQRAIVIKRMQGISITAIAEQLNVSQQAVSKQLTTIQVKVQETCPELIRGFKGQRTSAK